MPDRSSLRCTQSTVKSRRRSLARVMNSPRRRARVVDGGRFMASFTAISSQIRSTESTRLEAIEETALATDVVILKIDQRNLRVPEAEPVPLPGTPRSSGAWPPSHTHVRGSTGPIPVPSYSAPTCPERGPPRGKDRGSPDSEELV